MPAATPQAQAGGDDEDDQLRVMDAHVEIRVAERLQAAICSRWY